MLRKYKILVTVFVILTSILLLMTPCEAKKQTIKLKYGLTHGAPGLNSMGDVSQAWQQEVIRLTNGEISFENFWSGALGAPAEFVNHMKVGVIDGGIIFGWYTPAKMPFSNFEYCFPFGPVDYELVAKAKAQLRKEIPQFDKEMTDQNIILLADIPMTTYNFLSKEPIRSLEDFKGKKVGLIGRYFGRWLPPGATAVVRPGHDRYDMLKTGVIDVDLNPLENQMLFKLNEVTNYSISNLDVCTIPCIPICMNIDSFKKLSPKHQKAIREASKIIVTKATKEILPGWDKKIYAAWKKTGMKFIDFPTEEQKKWVETLDDIPAEWAAEMESKGLPGFKAVQRWQEITTELGYTWSRRWGIKK